MITPGTIAVVSPRFGPGVVGGAEAVLAELANGLAALGHPVELLTTCARDHFTWANEFPPGTFTDGEIAVRRFETETDSPGRERQRIGDLILRGDAVSIQDQQLWANDSLRCSGLWNHVFDHGHSYRAIIFGPYMFWTTYAVSALYPSRSIIMPCLHDEQPARLDIFASMIEGAGAVLFLTEPEQRLAKALYRLPDQTAVVGAPVAAPSNYRSEAFQDEFDIDGPYLYYAGRREWGKGWEDLRRAFGRYSQERGGRRKLRLVTSGVGPVEPLLGAELDLLDVGLLSDRQRDDAMAGATAYVQPSAMESFSRTVLEAMLAGTPVIANGESDVVAWHLDRSGAGLTYRSESELVQSLHFASDEPAALAGLAAKGRPYVIQNYDPGLVFTTISNRIDQWFPLTESVLA